jgi:hypothetical protein
MNTAIKKKHLSGITVDSNMRDHSKDAFFEKKAKKARAFIAKNGLPKNGKPRKGK